MTLLRELARHLTMPVSPFIATRGANDRPLIARIAVARVDEDGRVRVAIPLPEGEPSLAAIDANGLVALTASLPTNYKTFQAKGTDARREPWPDHADLAAKHLAEFTALITSLGLGRHVSENLRSNQRYETISFTPSDIFDQTPGVK